MFKGKQAIVDYLNNSNKHMASVKAHGFDSLWQIDGHIVFLDGQSFEDKTIHRVIGDTYPIREQLAAMGFTWDADGRYYEKTETGDYKSRTTQGGEGFIHLAQHEHHREYLSVFMELTRYQGHGEMLVNMVARSAEVAGKITSRESRLLVGFDVPERGSERHDIYLKAIG